MTAPTPGDLYRQLRAHLSAEVRDALDGGPAGSKAAWFLEHLQMLDPALAKSRAVQDLAEAVRKQQDRTEG